MSERLSSLWGSMFGRLLGGLLLVALVPTIVLAVLLSSEASDALEDQARTGLTTAATGVVGRVNDWIGLRRDAVEIRAGQFEARRLRDPQAFLTEHASSVPGFDGFAITDLSGRVRAQVGDPRAQGIAAAEFFQAAAGGRGGASEVLFDGNRPLWYVAQPLTDLTGRPRLVFVGRLDATVLDLFVDVSFGVSGEAVLADSQGRLLATSLGDSGGIRPGSPLGRPTPPEGMRRALAGSTGAVKFTDYRDTEVIGGYAPVRSLGWGAVVKRDEDEALAAVSDQRNTALVLVLITAALAVGFALFYARRTSDPLRRLAALSRRVSAGELSARAEPSGTTETRELGEAFNTMLEGIEQLIGRLRAAGSQINSSATELSTASDELAATTTQQNAAATETSTTMEELATTSASIAENIEAIAEQTADTRSVLAEADSDFENSSERTLALAKRVEDITSILDLINEIADKTSLLALNAAIEAARAGESGRGFTVVADEVRKLAERSKQSAGEIALIVEGTKAETNATVMSMEKGSNQMRHGLDLMDSVALATDQAKLTTQQQRAAAAQVVDAMQSVTAASRQTSATAHQMAESSSNLAELASELHQAAGVEGETTPVAPGTEEPPPAADGGDARPNGAPRPQAARQE